MPPSTVEDLFLAALDRPADERSAFVEAACAGDPDRLARVRELLAAHDQSRGPLDAPPVASPTAEWPPAVNPIGTMIGLYKPVEVIGEGGMGTVYLAQQQKPVRRLVALKVIKAGMDTAQVIARFEAERQALALMDHPNIAKVFDAGATADGRPYFVMELVKGVPITRYCDEHRLTPRQRLELFVAVCQAVQHAHQKGIIHRDLKPSNVLVAPYDGRPVPKVIDFGVAKAAGAPLTDKTLVTRLGAVVGTLEYMSPEQAELNNLDVDTRSDVYALGVLLYELLTGTTPLPKERLKSAAFWEALRVIREEEPPRPSTRLSTTEELPSIAANRGLEPKKLSGLVRGELDWIVMKALEKDRTRRYETANGLAMDVQRYLADEVVEARPPGAGYRFRKLLRRHKGPVLAVSLVFLALVGGVVGTTLGLLESRRQEGLAREAQQKEADRAEAEAAQRRRARKAVDDMYTQVAQKWLAHEPRMQKVQREFLEKALAYYEELSNEEGSDPAVRFETVEALGRMGSLYQKLGQNAKGAAAFGRAADMLERLTAEFPADRKYRQELADTYHRLGHLRMYSNQLAEAESLFGKALTAYQQLIADFGSDRDLQSNIAASRHSLGNVMSGLMGGTPRLKEAKEAYRQAADIYRELVVAAPETAEYQSKLGATLNDWAMAFLMAGDVAGAGPLFKEAIGRQRAAIKLESHRAQYRQFLSSHLASWADIQQAQGDRAAALKANREALAVQQALADDFPDVPHYRHATAERASELGERLKADDADGAAASFRQAIAMLEPLADSFTDVPARRVLLADCYKNLGLALDALGRPDEAAAAFRSAVKWEPKEAVHLHVLGWHLLARKQFAEAEPVFRESLKVREQNAPDAWRTFNAKAMLGASLLGQKKYAEAEPLLVAGYEGLKQREATLDADGRDNLTEVGNLLVQLYEAWGRPDRAADWRKKLATPKKPGKKD